MKLNADFTKPALVRPEEAVWRPSPEPGVERLMLDRIGDERARATSIVRYAPKSRFPEHFHDAGEEFLVLDGTFSDAAGDYGPGTYVRNPPGSRHAPWSADGTTIFVKLRQFDADDRTPVVIRSGAATWTDGPVAGVRTLALHAFGAEQVRLHRLDPGAVLECGTQTGGAEVLVIDGRLDADGDVFGTWAWLRWPTGAVPSLQSDAGATLYMKSGHLR